MTIKEKMDALMQDEAFVKSFESAKSPEEIIELYKENGIEVTPENAQAGYDYMHKSDELDIDALENVSGGTGEILAGIATIATAAVITAGVVAVGTAAVGLAAAGAVLSESEPQPQSRPEPHRGGPGPHHGGPHHGGPHHGGPGPRRY